MKVSEVCRYLLLAMVAILAFFNSPSVRGDDKAKDQGRLQNSGQVMKEIVEVPDSIPQKLLDKADCVIVIPIGVEGRFYRRR